MSTPMLSIIVPTLNEAATIPRFIQSLRAQRFQDYELIVANSPATVDGTADICQSHGCVLVKGGKAGEGRNRGAEVARGEILLFLDADVVFPNSQFLEDVIQEFEERHLDVAAPDIAPLSNRLMDRAGYNAYNWYARFTQRFWPHAPGFCMLARRSVHRIIKGFDETVAFAEDHEYAQRAHAHGFHFGILVKPEPIQTDMRRFEKDGWVKTLAVYFWTDIRMKFFGPYRYKTPFTYKMGGEVPDDSKKSS